ncbi:MAG: NADH-quinone oxidoreductase subunit C [SAR324 cluster bacterium]|nr:NADH-quinone oxidoreductase subunit C [SAR324 cluster bacterium]
MSTEQEEIGNLTQLLQEQFPGAVQSYHQHRGDETVLVERSQILPICQFLRDDERSKMEMMIDLTAVDYIKESPRFEVVYHFKSLSLEHRIRVKVRVPEEDCEIDSIHELWLAVDWYERECYDMYGIIFKNHPNLQRILMYSQFEGYPLRKDYPIGRQQPLVEMRPVNERHDYGEL